MPIKGHKTVQTKNLTQKLKKNVEMAKRKCKDSGTLDSKSKENFSSSKVEAGSEQQMGFTFGSISNGYNITHTQKDGKKKLTSDLRLLHLLVYKIVNEAHSRTLVTLS